LSRPDAVVVRGFVHDADTCTLEGGSFQSPMNLPN
jgi:hypothetical protein